MRVDGDVSAAPANIDALHAYIERMWAVRLARVPIAALAAASSGAVIDRASEPSVAASAAPMDYIAWAFFEGLPPSDAPPATTDSLDAPIELRRAPSDAVVWASRGGGKTFLGALATALDLIFKPGIEVRVLAGSLEQAARMHHHLRAFFRTPALEPLIAGRITDRRLTLISGSRVEVLAASQTSVRGSRVQKLRCDEVDLFHPAVWEAVQLTTRSLDVAGPWGPRVRGSVEALSTLHIPGGLMSSIVADSTPIPGRPGTDAHPSATRALFRWSVLDVLEHCPPERSCDACALLPECAGRAKLRAPGDAGHLRIDDALAQRARVSLATWSTEMLCRRANRTDAVFPEFDPAVHLHRTDAAADPTMSEGAAPPPSPTEAPLVQPLPPAHPLAPEQVLPGPVGPQAVEHIVRVCAMDFGWRNPTFAILATLSPDGTLHIVDERSWERTAMEQIIDDLRAAGWGPSGPAAAAWIGVDPAGHQRTTAGPISPISLLRRAGWTVRAARVPLARGLELVRRRLEPRADTRRPPRDSLSRAIRAAALRSTRDASAARGDQQEIATHASASTDPGPSLFIHPRCSQLTRALSNYRWPGGRPDAAEPLKDGSDHAADALRYLIVNLDRHLDRLHHPPAMRYS